MNHFANAIDMAHKENGKDNRAKRGRPKTSEDGKALSPREQQILTALQQGRTYMEIAKENHISKNTVKTHVRNIYNKLEVSTKVQAINKFFQDK